MLIRTSLKQTLRTPVKLIAYFLVTALAAASFCVGLNQETSAQNNFAAAEESFTTVAVPTLYADSTPDGYLYHALEPEEFQKLIYKYTMKYMPREYFYSGYKAVASSEYDLSSIRSAVGVESINVCGRFGAYVNGSLFRGYNPLDYPNMQDVIIFTYNGESEIDIVPGLGVESAKIPITVIFSANTNLYYGNSISLENNIDAEMAADAASRNANWKQGMEFTEEGSFRLKPGKQYIAILEDVWGAPESAAWSKPINAKQAAISNDYYHAPHGYYFQEYPEDGKLRYFLPIAEYGDGFFQTDAGAYFEETLRGYQTTANSLTAIATEDLAAMRPFHSGGVHISQGRSFSEEEYTRGVKVCIVSEYMAELNGWRLGDTVSLSFYPCAGKYYVDSDEMNVVRSQNSLCVYPVKDFFDEGEYAIVGMFAGNVNAGSKQPYTRGVSLDAVNVLLPTNSVANAPLPEISQYTTSIRLKNSEAQAFMAEMAVSGLMEEQPGGYELGLTVYDQGYSHVAPGLNQLSRVSRLTLLLSAGAAGAAVLALALLHVLRMRREIAAMRSLGTKKGQIVVLSLAGILLVCLLGACAGAYAGHMVSAEVAGRVLAGAEEAAVDTTFTAMMGEETAKEFTFTLESDPKLAVAAGGAAVVAFTLLALLLLAAELRRPPMCLLAEKE